MSSTVAFEVPLTHPALEGHFPGHPVVPGVVVLEAVIEAARARHGHEGTALGLPMVKFLAPLLPAVAATIELSGAPPQVRFEVRSAAGVHARGSLAWGPRP